MFEGFDDKPVDGQNPVPGWSLPEGVYSSDGSFSVVNSTRGLTSLKAGYLNQSTAYRYRAYRGVGGRYTTGNFAWDFYAKALRNDRGEIMALTDEASDASYEQPVILRFGENTKIGYQPGDAPTDIMAYEANGADLSPF
jgi:hypothetical protein